MSASENHGFSAVDVFCGVGGLTHGLLKAGIPVRAGIDIDEGCRYPYEKNNGVPFIRKDITVLTAGRVLGSYDDPGKKILVGCAPCQPFSNHTQKIRNRGKDKKWDLLYSYARIIQSTSPEIISMENVPPLIRYDPFKDLIRVLEKMKYFINYSVVNCEKYGVPQYRKRLVLLASKYGEIALPPATHDETSYMTVRDAISDLEVPGSGETSKTDPLHKTRKLSELNLKRLTVSKPGGTWESWSDDLKCPCHKKNSGSTYKSVYGRMEWDKPAPTITTQLYNYGSGRFGHPEQDRALSLREGAILQSFPRDYIFEDPSGDSPLPFQRIGTYIGNAVPVKLGEIIGTTIKKHIEAYCCE